MKKLKILALIMCSFKGFSQPDHTGDFEIDNGILDVSYTSSMELSSTGIDNLSGIFGKQGLGGLYAGDVHLRGYWGVVIDKNGGNFGESGYYSNGVLPAGGSFAVRTRTSSTSFRTDLIIRNNGFVGIGTTTPESKLAVNGQIRATEVKILADISVPDYVFEPDYELRTLKETKKYIAENKHLPEIPSASEIGDNGIDLGDMNMRLLKKIEELTLYQIQLMEEMEAMKKELQELKK